jgi:hypothetical protein
MDQKINSTNINEFHQSMSGYKGRVKDMFLIKDNDTQLKKKGFYLHEFLIS